MSHTYSQRITAYLLLISQFLSSCNKTPIVPEPMQPAPNLGKVERPHSNASIPNHTNLPPQEPLAADEPSDKPIAPAEKSNLQALTLTTSLELIPTPSIEIPLSLIPISPTAQPNTYVDDCLKPFASFPTHQVVEPTNPTDFYQIKGVNSIATSSSSLSIATNPPRLRSLHTANQLPISPVLATNQEHLKKAIFILLIFTPHPQIKNAYKLIKQ